MSLVVEGEVIAPVELSFADLAALPEQVADISALVPGREGSGVRLSAVLGRAGLKPNATHVTCESTDGKFTASVPLSAVREAIVAYRLGDAPLPESKGGPIRFFIPEAADCDAADIDQCANVKYLGRLRVTKGAGTDTRPQSAREHAALHTHHDK